MSESLKIELIERYEATGKVGFVKPKTKQEAYKLIETITELYETKAEEENKVEEVVISLQDITERLRNFFKDF